MLRGEGTAVLLTRTRTDTPPLMAWHVRQNRCLYADVIMMTVATSLVLRVAPGRRCDVVEERPRFWRFVVRCRSMGHVDFEGILPALEESGCTIDLEKVAYHVARETIVRADRTERLLAPCKERIFAWMKRH